MKLVTLFALWIVFVPLLHAVPSLLDQGRAAETAENYQAAVDLYRKAMKDAPGDPAPARALAELFTAKNLHNLALPVWQELVRRTPADPTAWLSLGQTWSYLDQNQQSVSVLSEAAARFPQRPEVVQSYAWMLFKTEAFQRGIDVVEAFIAQHGSDRSLEMTLGTLYSSLLDYGRSRAHYLRSLELAPGNSADARNFRSIAWYNLSLLEKDFYHFDLAEADIRQSLQEEDRPAGALALGELAQDRRDFVEARRLFVKAMKADETPLARFDLARLYLQFGFLDQAQDELEQVEHHRDDTWIFNYGVTKAKLRRDLAELGAQLHRAKYYRLNFAVRRTPLDWAVWCYDKVTEAALWWYREQTWRRWLSQLAESSERAHNSSDAWIGLSMAQRDRPAIALKYLKLVRDQELPRNPNAQASFLVEEGILKRDASTLSWALTRLQTPGENEDRERALITLAQIAQQSGDGKAARSAWKALFALNPAALPNHGWGLPVRTAVFGDPQLVPQWKGAIREFQGQSGWGGADDDSLDELSVNVSAEQAAWSLRTPEGDLLASGAVRSGDVPLEGIAQIFWAIHSPHRPSR